MEDEERRRLRKKLRHSLARYRGGSFSTGESGGAVGMMFFRDAAGQEFYIGGMGRDDAQRVTEALNAVLRLME